MSISHYFIHPGDILWNENCWSLLYESPARANATFTTSDLWHEAQAKNAANMSTWWQPEVQRCPTRKAKERQFEALLLPGLIPPGRSMLVLEKLELDPGPTPLLLKVDVDGMGIGWISYGVCASAHFVSPNELDMDRRIAENREAA